MAYARTGQEIGDTDLTKNYSLSICNNMHFGANKSLGGLLPIFKASCTQDCITFLPCTIG